MTKVYISELNKAGVSRKDYCGIVIEDLLLCKMNGNVTSKRPEEYNRFWQGSVQYYTSHWLLGSIFLGLLVSDVLSRWYSGRGFKLTSRHDLLPTLLMRRAVPTVPLSWPAEGQLCLWHEEEWDGLLSTSSANDNVKEYRIFLGKHQGKESLWIPRWRKLREMWVC